MRALPISQHTALFVGTRQELDELMSRWQGAQESHIGDRQDAGVMLLIMPTSEEALRVMQTQNLCLGPNMARALAAMLFEAAEKVEPSAKA